MQIIITMMAIIINTSMLNKKDSEGDNCLAYAAGTPGGLAEWASAALGHAHLVHNTRFHGNLTC